MDILNIKSNTFVYARIKLTAYYILFISVIIILLTLVAFNAKESSFISVKSAVGETISDDNSVIQFQKSFDEFNRVFRQRLIISDFIIIILATIFSWWMSGKTLKPINNMIKEQKNFAADISHELRTPLTTIQLEIQTLQKLNPRLPKNFNNLLISISEEVIRMTHMVQGLLLIVRTNQPSNFSSFEEVKLAKVIDRASDSIRPLALQKKITLKTSLSHDPVVLGDFDQLLQVVLILIDNAIKYSPAKSVIKINLDVDKSAALITVTDQGYGIPQVDQKAIFNRFYRSGSIGDTKAAGSGLGLAIAQRIIVNHSGSINIVSKEDIGSTFTIRIPLSEIGI